MIEMKTHPILQVGRNCWTADAPVDAAGLLVDGRNYFRAFYRCAAQAQRYILMAGWRFNSDIRLMRGEDAECEAGEDVKLLPYLEALCQANPELRIYVLAWDFSLIFAHKWELFQEWRFEWNGRGQIDYQYDDNHPVGASHHQKLVVVDGHVGFVGGLDFNADDWDDRRHLAKNPQRADSGQSEHPPYHDLQGFITGPAVQELTEYFKRRWVLAGGKPLELPAVPEPAPPNFPHTPLRANRVAIACNEPAREGQPEPIQQIRNLYIDAIAAARQLIYIENQYFSSSAVYDALLERMSAKRRTKLDIVLVLPRQLPAWSEQATLGPPRLRMIRGLREAAAEYGHNLGIYYPAATGGGPEHFVVIHSKVLIVDDRFLTVGSANTSNRSMGLDTELNLAFEAQGRQRRQLESSIRRFRVSLLAEHCAGAGRADIREKLRQLRGIVPYLNELAENPQCKLYVLDEETIASDSTWVALLAEWGMSLDPERPIGETLFEPLTSSIYPAQERFSWLRKWIPGM